MPQVGTWSTVWRTDELDNDGASISGMVHVPGIPGLPGGDGHAGYLITAASQLLSLYECSASGGRGEASLQVPEQAAPLQRQQTMRKVHPGDLLSVLARMHFSHGLLPLHIMHRLACCPLRYHGY